MALKNFSEQKFRKKDGMPYGFKPMEDEDTREAQYNRWSAGQTIDTQSTESEVQPYDEKTLALAETRKARNDPNMQRLLNSPEYKRKQKEYSQRAIELARSKSSSNSDAKPNAGDDRTTAYKQPQTVSDYSGLGTLPTYSGMNIASNGADIDYSEVNKKATENGKGWKGLIGTKSEEQTISKAESLEHANEVYAPYANNKEVTDLFNQYVDWNDKLEMDRMTGNSEYSKYHDVQNKKKTKKEIQKLTGLSSKEFDHIAENYTYIRHDEQRKQQQSDIDNASGWKKGALTVGNALGSTIGNYYSMFGALKKPNDPELGRDYNSAEFFLSNLNRDTKEAVHNDIDDSTMSDFQKFATGFGYDALTMGAESATSQLFGGAGLASYFAGGYASALEEAEERGLTKGQAQGYALASGGLEYATEKIPWEGLRSIYAGEAVSKDLVKGSLKPYVKAFLKQSGEEAGEEVVNGLGDLLADSIINADKSKLNISINNYVSQGYSEEDAMRKAFMDEGQNILYAAASAFASTGASAGPALGVQAYAETSTGRDIAKNSDSYLNNAESQEYIANTREAYNSDEDYNKALETRQKLQQAAEQAAQKKRISGKAARAITSGVREAYDNMNAKARVVFQQQVEAAQEEAEKKTIERVEKATSAAELETIKEENIRNESVVAAVKEKESQLVESGKVSEDEFAQAITPSKAREIAKSGEEIKAEKLEQLPQEVQDAYKVGYSEKVHEVTQNITNEDITKINYSEEGKSKTEAIKSVTSDRDQIIFETESGAKVPASEVRFNNKAKYLYNRENGILSLDNPALVQMAIDIEAASQNGISVANVTIPLKTMYTAGEAGISFDEAYNGLKVYSNAISKDILQNAYNEGAKLSVARTRATTNVRRGRGLIVEQSEGNEDAYKAQFRDAKGDYSEEVQRKYESEVSDTEKKFLELLSKKIGTDIRFTSDDSGNRGEYKPNEGAIYLNLNNDINMFEVALHEGIGEFLAASNEKAYNQIADSVLSAYAAMNSNKLASDIRAYQKAYANDQYGDTARGASRELFNDAIGEILSSESNLKKMFDWMVTNEGEKQAQKVKKTLVDYFHDLVDMIKSIKKLGGLTRLERNRMRLSEDQANKYADMIFKAMDEAIANRDAAVSDGKQEESAPRNSKYVTNEEEDIRRAEKKLKKQLDEWLKGIMPKEGYFDFGKTPSIMRKYGAKANQIIMKEDAILKFTTDYNNHTVSLDSVASIPSAIANPEYIYKGSAKNSLAIFTSLKDKEGAPIMVAIHLDWREKRLVVNRIASIYGKNNFEGYQKANKDKLLYDKKRSGDQSTIRGRQLPKMVQTVSSASNNSISSDTKKSTATSSGEIADNIPTARSSKHVFDNPTTQLEVEGNLIVVHNLTADKLLKVLTYGGIPMPSLAVTKAEIGHTNFGNITLVFNKDTIDPKKNKKNHTYSADVWSPVFPQIEYDINNDVIAAVDETLRKADIPDWIMRNATNKYSDMERKLQNSSLDEILNDFKQDVSLQAVYLSAIQKIPVELMQTEQIAYMNEKTIEKAKFIQSLGNIDDIYKMPFAELEEKVGLPLIKYLNKLRKAEDANAKLMPETLEYLENSKMAKLVLRHALEDTREYERTGGKEINIVEDAEAEKNFIRENIDTPAYEKWIEDSFKDVVNKTGIWNNKEYIDARGNKRTFDQLHYAVTAENIVKFMLGSSEDIRNASGFNHGIKGIRSVVAEDFKSIDDIRNASDKLTNIDSGIYDDMLEKLYKRHSALMDEIIDQSNRTGNRFMYYDSVDSAIMESAANPSVKNIIKTLKEYSWDITEDQAKEIADIISEVEKMPVNMFEAKPQRVVAFDEILKAVIPSDSDETVKNALAKAGIEYVEYETGNEEQRREIISSTEGARFSKKIDWDTHNSYEVPARTYEDTVGFFGTDEEIEAADQQDLAVKSYYANIIHSKKFAGLMFEYKDGDRTKQNFLTRSTRKGYDWQYSYGYDNEPYGHNNYKDVNDVVETYGSVWGDDMTSLYQELLEATPKEGVKVNVVREGIAEEGRKSKAVFGDASPYSETINQAEYVSKVLSTLNNQLKGTSVNTDYVMDTVKYILDKYQSTVDEHDLAIELAQFIAYMTQNDNVDYNQMMNYLMNIGDEIIQSSELKDPESERVFKELKQELSSHKISLSDTERKELTTRYGGDWKAVFGKLNSVGIKLDSKNGQKMDAGIYNEIANQFREIGGVYLDETVSPVDQIATIIDAMEAMQPTAYEWDGANQMDKALDVATTIIDRYYSMANYIKETNLVKGNEKGQKSVEKAKQAEIKRLRKRQAEWKEKLNSEFAALVEDKKKMVQEQQEFYRKQAEAEKKFRGEQRTFNRKVNMTEKELEKTAKTLAKMEYQGLKDTEAKRKHKENIVRTCTRLINWMNKPTDARHVPTFLKPALTDMIKAIDFMPASMRKGEDGTISAKKWQESMRKLQQVLTGLNTQSMESMDDSDKYNLALVLNAEDIVVRMEELLNKYNGTADISRMSREDLKTLSDIMKNISTGISKMNENFMNRRFKHVSDVAIASMDEMDKLKPISNKSNAIKSTAGEFLNLDMLDPYSFFHELGEASSSIMQEFYDGEKIGVEIIREAEDFFTALTDELGIKQKDLRQWENDKKDYTFDGKTITLTPAEIMSLYCSYNREKLDQQERPFEATHHIMSGGIKAKERKIGHMPTSPVVNRNAGVLHLTEAQVFELINTLTAEQIAYADKVVDYMSTTLAAHGNETSNKISGFSKFNGKKYFPLKTDTNTIATNESNSETGLAGLMRLIHPSFTKSQLDKADNALVLTNFFDVVTEHITGMSNYCAYAMPLSDAMRWYNYAETERNATDMEDVYWRDTRTLKASMEKVKGKGAKNYFENFLRDVNLDPANKGGSKFVGAAARALTGLGRAKAIGLNVSVWVQQPTAIVRASNVIEGKYLAQGISKMMLNPRKATAYAQDTNYLCYWKSKGFSDYRVSMGMKEIITGHNTKLQAAQEKAGAPAGLMDDVTWAAMYYAAENKIKATTDLDVNSEEYRKQVDELFSEIINQTQVIDSTLRTTQTMRSKNDFEYLANAFKKEPQKSYNMLHRAAFDAYQAESVEDKKVANRAFRKTLKAFLLTSVVNGMVVAAVQAWRDDDDENYLLKWLKKLTPYGSYEAIMSMLDEEKFEAKDILPLIRDIWGGIGTIGDNADLFASLPLISEVDSWLKGYEPSSINHLSILGEAHKTVTSLTSANATEYKVAYSLATLSDYVTGLGVSNIMRDIRGIWNQSTRATGLPRIKKSTKDVEKAEKDKEADRLTQVFDNRNLSQIKTEIQNSYDEYIEKGSDESKAWGNVRTYFLKPQFLRQLESCNNQSEVTKLINQYSIYVQATKEKDRNKDTYSNISSEDAVEKVKKWYEDNK